MNPDADRLYALLPAYLQAQDTTRGFPLRALLRIVGRQVEAVEANIATLYDDWFIETCQEWVVPYIGDLLGYEPIEKVGHLGAARSTMRDRVLIPRREIANTLRYRARKGTLALLEALAMDVGGYQAAAAVEFFGNVARYNGQVRDIVGRERFDAIVGTLPDGQTNIRLFVWRRRVYPVTLATPYFVETQQAEFYTFSPVGNNQPLYTYSPEREISADPLHLPIPITRERFAANKDAYYGEGKSLCLYAPTWPPDPNAGRRGDPQAPTAYRPIPSEYIIVGALDDASLRSGGRPRYPEAGANQIVVDPELGRFIFPARPRQRPNRELRASYHMGFSAEIGGGEYERPLSQHPHAHHIETPCSGLKLALEQALEALASDERQHIVIEIIDSGLYLGWLPEIVLREGQSLQIRAAGRTRPVLWLLERSTSLPDSLRVLPYPKSCFILDGVLIGGRGVHVDEPSAHIFQQTPDDAHVIIRHSTLIPGWQLLPENEPIRSEEASIELNNVLVTLTIQRSIVGSIAVLQEDRALLDPSDVVLEDSILDSTAGGDEPALYGDDGSPAYVRLTTRRSTIIGEVDVRELPLAENSIFFSTLKVFNRQGGLVRYSFVRAGSNTPPRFRCEPDLSAAEVTFVSQRYGTPGYAMLDETAEGIGALMTGAEFGGEMGVYHHLYNPVRRANLERRLRDYLPVDIDDVQVVFVT